VIKNILILLSLLSVNSIIISSEKKEEAESELSKSDQDADLNKLINIFFNKNMLLESLNQSFEQLEEPIDIKDVTDKISEKLSSASVRDQLKELYSKHYTADEISQLAKFYESPLGKKCIEKTPVVTGESSKIVSTIVTEILSEVLSGLNIDEEGDEEEENEV